MPNTFNLRVKNQAQLHPKLNKMIRMLLTGDPVKEITHQPTATQMLNTFNSRPRPTNPIKKRLLPTLTKKLRSNSKQRRIKSSLSQPLKLTTLKTPNQKHENEEKVVNDKAI